MTFAYASQAKTPQTQPLRGRNMVANNAGGFVFALTQEAWFDRFLVMGTAGGTYYVGEQKMTDDAISALTTLFASADGPKYVARLVEISDQGRAIKNSPAIAALAVASVSQNEATRKAAFAAVPKVCRIGTHLFEFAQYRQDFGGGWGRGVRNAIGNWYRSKPTDALALQLLKYAQREGWSHRDLLRLSHPKSSPDKNLLFDVTCRPTKTNDDGTVTDMVVSRLSELPRLYTGASAIKTADAKKAAELIREYDLPRELVPTELLKESAVWAALLEKMPYTALIRNLGNLSKHGLLKPLSKGEQLVKARLADMAALKKARVHPVAMLVAARVYGNGHGVRGDNTWNVNPNVVTALDEAFLASFQFVQPTNKRLLLAIDVSGSMTSALGDLCISSCEAAAAMAMVFARTEPNTYTFGFAKSFKNLGITAKDSLKDATRKAQDHNFGSTNCAAPMEYALSHGIEADGFVVITDCETYAGSQHPTQALKKYRQKTGINAKLAVLGTTSNNFTIADPKDPGQMDFCGFDTSTPVAVSEFLR